MTRRTITITIDHLPPADLNPNRLSHNIHWTKRSLVERRAREEGYYLALEQWKQAKPMQKVRVSILFTFKDNRDHDLDNILSAAKPYLDGFKDAGLIVGDSYKHLSYGRIEGENTGKEQTIIKIQEV